MLNTKCHCAPMLSVIVPNAECHYAKSYCVKCYYVECRYATCYSVRRHYVEYHYAKCYSAKCHYAECHYAKCYGAKCHYAEGHHAQCHGTVIRVLNNQAAVLVTSIKFFIQLTLDEFIKNFFLSNSAKENYMIALPGKTERTARLSTERLLIKITHVAMEMRE